MIFDTDVLIWYFRGNAKAQAAVNNSLPFSVSAVTVMELMQGAKNKAEQKAITKQLRTWGVDVMHINEAVSIRAGQYVSEFALSHGIGAMDALIAGTAAEAGDELLTANTKHFGFIPAVKLKKFQP
ncbi:MAG: type II toxin-antitoxin system VapC family toxin [Clostridiales Family XIII bacterium]|jgi:predicted nucleic acid-binding protein|nr:type II toxin-antitoxin system VapC family toxin [Clostridiales Family XIII bacterium]